MNFSWCQIFMNRLWSGDMIHDYLFETDGVGLVLSILPFVALMAVVMIHYLDKMDGGKK